VSGVYVAAASAELPRAQAAMRQIREAGVRVVGDWTDDVLRYGSEGATHSDEARAAASAAQLDFVGTAGAVLLLIPPKGVATKGAWAEAGVARALGIQVVASCSAPRLPWIVSWAEHRLTDLDAIERAVWWAGGAS